MSISATSSVSPYLSELYSLNQYDTEELMQVSFGTPSAALTNVTSVLAQAATLDGELSMQPSDSSTSSQSSSGTGSGSTGSAQTTASSDPLNLPSYSSLISQSYNTANTTLQNYANAPAGSSIVDYQA